jgi:hypothetical protein
MSLNICKSMTFFFKIWPEFFKKNFPTLQILRLQLKAANNQFCILVKSIMQLTVSISLDSAMFIEKKGDKLIVAKT